MLSIPIISDGFISPYLKEVTQGPSSTFQLLKCENGFEMCGSASGSLLKFNLRVVGGVVQGSRPSIFENFVQTFGSGFFKEVVWTVTFFSSFFSINIQYEPRKGLGSAVCETLSIYPSAQKKLIRTLFVAHIVFKHSSSFLLLEKIISLCLWKIWKGRGINSQAPWKHPWAGLRSLRSDLWTTIVSSDITIFTSLH